MRRKTKKEPSRPHPSQRPNQMDAQGHVMSEEELREGWKRQGLCPRCGLVRTTKSLMFGMKKEALTVPGRVYKGICLQCYTLDDAKQQLGEVDASHGVTNINQTLSREGPSTEPSRTIGSKGNAADPSSASRAISHTEMSPLDDRAGRSPPSRVSRDRADLSEESYGTILPSDIPQNVGPRMGGIQKQISEITLDSTMLGLSAYPLHYHPTENSLSRSLERSLGDIHENVFINHRDESHGQSSGPVDNNSLSRVGVASKGTAERIEAKIRAKHDAGDAECRSTRHASGTLFEDGEKAHHVHFTSSDNSGGDHVSTFDKKAAVEQLRKKATALNRHPDSLSIGERSGSDDVQGIFSRLKADDSGIDVSMPGAVIMQADRTNFFEQRLKEKESQYSVHQSLVNEPPSPNEKQRSLPAFASTHHMFQKSVQVDDHQGGVKPGSTRETPHGGRPNTFEDRLRHKIASQSPNAQAHSNTNASISRHTVDPLSNSISSEQTTKPGAFHESSSQEDGRLNIFEERIRQKSAAQSLYSAETGELRQQSGDITNIQHASGQLKKSKSLEQRTTPGIIHEADMSASNFFNRRVSAKLKGDEIPSVNPKEQPKMEKTNEAPGALQVTGSHFNKIIERKLENTNMETYRIHHSGDRDHQHHHECSGTGTNDDARSELLEIKKAGNCDEIIGFLRVNATAIPPSTIIFAFECIREVVCGNYKESTMSTVFRSKVSWLKIFSSLMYTHFSNEVVQFEALRTLWAIASFSPRHVTDITLNDEIMESVVDSMEGHSSDAVQEYGCGLIACLAVSQPPALKLLECCDGQIVQRLMTALTSPSRNGTAQIYALRALCRLSSAVLCSEKCEYFFGDEMGRFITNGQFVGCPTANSVFAVLNAMQNPKQLSLVIEGSRLLCQIFTRDAMMADVFFTVAKEVLHFIESILAVQSQSSVLHEEIIYLLSNISCYGSEIIEEPVTFTTNVLSIMSAHADSSIIALHGCRSIYNLCASEQMKKDVRLTFASLRGINKVLKCMSAFPKHIDIQGEACGALFAVCCESPTNKKSFMESGGLDAIILAFDANCGVIESTEDDSLSFLIRACAVLITLSVDPCALKEIERRGIIKKFCLLLEDGPTIPESLRCKMQELVDMTLDNETPPLCFGNELSEEDTSDYLLLNLKGIIPPNKVDSKKSILLQSNTISAMQKFPNILEIQATGCKILSHIFGSKSNSSSEGLDTALSCISSKHSSLTSASASVFRNFCLTQSSVQLDVYEAQCLSNTLVRSTDELITAIQVHKSDQVVVEQVSAALWAIASAEKGVVLSFESRKFVSLILDVISKFHCPEVQRNCLGILYELCRSSEKILDFLTENLIVAVLDCLESDEEDVADVAVSTAWIISDKGAFPARMMMLNHHEKLIGAVVTTMFKFPRSPLITRASCDILSNISLDNYFRLAITSFGGTGRVNNALVEFNADELTTCKALMSLTNLISGADVDVLCMNDVARNILQAMSRHEEALYVQICGASAIWHLASRDDMFKDILVEIGAVRHISNGMTRFIASEKMTRKGLVAIWSLSVPKKLKPEVGLDGLVPVLNGLSAHLSSEKVCEEGLGALKSLSTVNKEMLEENDALDLIYSCMWLHSHNPSIQQASLAALVNLTVNLETNQVCRITSEDLDTIVNIIRIHQNSKAVQENAIILLRNFTFSPHNCRILQENNFLVGLIHTAMLNFRDTFQGRAEDLLRVLPQDNRA